MSAIKILECLAKLQVNLLMRTSGQSDFMSKEMSCKKVKISYGLFEWL